jgi:hypothetical protein
MKISSLFDLLTDASNVLDFFEQVETPEQLVSRLEHLKRRGCKDLLACLDGLRGSVADVLDDSLEVSALGQPGPDTETEISDEELAALANDSLPEETVQERQNLAPKGSSEEEKIDPP